MTTSSDVENSQRAADPPRRPWRTSVTPMASLLDEDWEGEGTEEKPFLVRVFSGSNPNPFAEATLGRLDVRRPREPTDVDLVIQMDYHRSGMSESLCARHAHVKRVRCL
jgi:hypothetical protein